MSKFRPARPAKRTAGAVKPLDRDRCDRDDADLLRAKLTEVVASNWSYAELQRFAAEQERDRERLAEIMGIFGELSQHGAIEESLFAQHHWRNAQRKQERLDTKLLDRGEHKKRCARDRTRYTRIKNEQPQVYAQILRRARERTREWARIHRPNKGTSTRRLTADSARQLREHHAAGVPQKDLAAIHGLTLGHVGTVLSGEAWPDAGGPLGRRFAPARGEGAANVALTEALVLDIRDSNEPAGVIAERLRVNPQTIYDVRIGRTWKHVGGKIVAPKKQLNPARVPFDAKAYKARWHQENRALKSEAELARIAEQQRVASARYYERHKDQILAKRRVDGQGEGRDGNQAQAS